MAGWSLERKLLAAAKLATKKLPREMQEQFAALFSPTSVAITGAVLVAWAASHLVGIGEGVDFVLLLIGLGTIGWQAFKVGEDVGAFLKIAGTATTEADLDRASVHLAKAVATIGVTVFVALIFKAGARLGGIARASALAKLSFWGRSVEEWLILIGKPKAPPLVRQRLKVALDFLREKIPGKAMEDIKGYVQAMDLSKLVRRTTLNPGQEVIMYGDPNYPGLFVTKVGTSMDRIGIQPDGREFIRLRVNTPIEALESRAGPAADSWTQKGIDRRAGMTSAQVAAKKYQPYMAAGGGLQYIVPDIRGLLASGALSRVPRP